MFRDTVMNAYLLLLVISGYNFILFLTWGVYVKFKEHRKMSSVFWGVTALFGCIGVSISVQAYARHVTADCIDLILPLQETIKYAEEIGHILGPCKSVLGMIKTLWWAYRFIPLCAVLAAIGIFMTRRLYLSYFSKNKRDRRTKPNRRGADLP